MTDDEQSRPLTKEERDLRLMYDVALAQLRLHPALIWTRNNFFLLTQTGLLAFVSNMLTRQLTKPLLLAEIGICIVGSLVAFVWIKVNKAGQTIQRNWREIVKAYEQELFKRENLEAKTEPGFSAKRSPFLQGADSVHITSYLINLSIGFLILWIAFLVGGMAALVFL